MGKRKYHDKAGAAEYCDTTVRHIERLQSERKLAYVKVGGKVRFLESDSGISGVGIGVQPPALGDS